MKNIVIGILIVTTALFGGLYFQQHQKVAQAETSLASVASLQKEADDLRTRLVQEEAITAKLREAVRNTAVDAAVNAGEAANLQQALTVAEHSAMTNAKPANPLADMFKSPEMRDMIKTQQKAVFGPMIDKNYAEYIAGLQMTPEQSASLKELITKKMLVDAGMGMDMLSGDLDADKRAELVKQAKADKEAIDAEIKQFLGADNYTQFQSYEKTLPDRTTLGQFKDQLATGTGALNAEQEQKMMEVMSTERSAFKFTTDYNDESKFDGDFATYFTDEKMNKFFTEQEQLSERYLARAQGILTADQLAAYQKFLTGQRDMMKAGMKMAQQMFGPKSGGK